MGKDLSFPTRGDERYYKVTENTTCTLAKNKKYKPAHFVIKNVKEYKKGGLLVGVTTLHLWKRFVKSRFKTFAKECEKWIEEEQERLSTRRRLAPSNQQVPENSPNANLMRRLLAGCPPVIR